MNILDARFRYTPALNTNIRETFARFDPDDDWKCRKEGALIAMKRLQQSATVTAITTRRKAK